MQCPRDQSELTIRDTEGHVGFLCPTCKGAWLPSKYLQSIEYMRVFSYAEFLSSFSKLAVGNGLMSCPSGCGHLHQVKSNDIALDWCPKCQGAWFDRGAITELLARFQLRETGVGQTVAEQSALAVLGGILGALLP